MNAWEDFERASPELALFGSERINNGVAYIATVSGKGWPRVHPVGPILGEGHLFLFMEPNSPKAHDLGKNGRYALHSAVTDRNGSNGEFFIRGHATLIQDPQIREVASQIPKPKSHYVLFELSVEEAIATTYEDNRPLRKKWLRPEK